MLLQESDSTSVPNAPPRRLDRNDKALLKTTTWLNKSELRLEDKVTLAHPKAVFLQGLVVFVGEVHFDDGIWVGIQLTGPSIGKGDCDGTIKGKKYFARVGKNNGVMAPLGKVTKRVEVPWSDQESPEERLKRTEGARMKALGMVDVLTDARAAAILQDHEKHSTRYRFHKEETYILRLKETQLGDAIKGRSNTPLIRDFVNQSKQLVYSHPGSTLCESDFTLCQGLEMTKQNFCVSDPLLPDNPITFASQAFLDMTGYHLSEILGRNCRFLQGLKTDKTHVDRVRQSIAEGADCHVCLLNYRKDGTPFYNRLFMTALRDTRGRIKNYLGVQCEVSKEVADKINGEEKKISDAGLKRNGTHFTKRRTDLTEESYTEDCQSNSQRLSTSSASVENMFSAMTMEEALIRATMDDPWAPLSEADQKLMEATAQDNYLKTLGQGHSNYNKVSNFSTTEDSTTTACGNQAVEKEELLFI